MLYVVRADGSIEEVAGVTGMVGKDGTLTCVNARGREVAWYARGTVLTFGTTDSLKALAKAYRKRTA